MLGHFFRLVLIGFMLLPYGVVWAQTPGVYSYGYPEIDSYLPKTYKAHSQTWGIIQGPNGHMYFGNGDGGLEFNGNSWNLITTTSRNRMREFVIQNDKIFLIGTGDFGYLTVDSLGGTTFESLVEKIPDGSNPSMRQVVAYGDDIVYVERNAVHIWDIETQSFTSIPGEGLRSMFVHNDNLYIYRDDHYVVLEEGKLVKRTPPFIPEGVHVLEFKHFATGTYFSTSRAIFKLENNQASKVSDGADSIFENGYYSEFVVTNDGTLVIGAATGMHFYEDGMQLLHIDSESGLNADRVHYMYVDRDGGIWATQDQGVVRVNWHVPFRTFDKRNGLPGIVNDVLSAEGILYVTTHDGTFRYNAMQSTFEPVFSPNMESFKMLWIDGELMVLSSNGVFVHNPRTGSNRRILPYRGYKLFRSRVDESLIYVCSRIGLISFVWQNGRVLSETSYSDQISDLIRFIEEDETGNLWLGSTKDPLYRMEFSGEQEGPVITKYTSEHGLPVSEIKINKVGSEYLFSTLDGVFAFDGSRFSRHPDFEDKNLMVPYIHASNHENGIYLLYGNTPFMRLEAYQQTADGFDAWDKPELRLFESSGLWMAYEDEDQVIWLASTDGLVAYDPTAYTGATVSGSTMLQTVYSGGQVVQKNVDTGSLEGIPYRRNQLRFDFTLASFDLPENTQYRVQLEGMDESWSDWTSTSFKEYTQLPFGDYSFLVQGRDAMGREASEASFHFTILTPWYAQGAFLWPIGVALLGLIVLTVRYYSTRTLKTRVDELETAHEVQQERERISRNLHDDVGAQLTSIISGIKAAEGMEMVAEKEEIREMLTSLKIDAEESIANLRDTIWTLNKESIDIHDFIDHIDAFRINALKYENIESELTFDVRQDGLIKPLVAFNLKKMVQESLQNILKHAHANRVTFHIEYAPERLQIVIADDGIGFNVDANERGHYGLKNMKQRARETGAEFSIESSDRGTTVSISVDAPSGVLVPGKN